MEFIVLHNQPFSVMGDVGFFRLVKPWYTLPSPLFFLMFPYQSYTVIASLLLASRHTYNGTLFGSLRVKKDTAAPSKELCHTFILKANRYCG
jgi:hypothetical protein